MINGYNSYGGGYKYQPSFFPNMPKPDFGKFPNMQPLDQTPNVKGWGKTSNSFGGLYGNNMSPNYGGDWTKIPNMNWKMLQQPNQHFYPIKQMPNYSW